MSCLTNVLWLKKDLYLKKQSVCLKAFHSCNTLNRAYKTYSLFILPGKAVLAATNDYVNDINKQLLESFPGETVTFKLTQPFT